MMIEPLKAFVYGICQLGLLFVLIVLMICLALALVAMLRYFWEWCRGLKEQRILKNKKKFEEWFKHEIACRTEIGKIGYKIDRIGIYRYMDEDK